MSGNFFLILPTYTNSHRLDFNDILGSASFTATKDWRSMLPEWSSYAADSFGKSSPSPSTHYSYGGCLQAPAMMQMRTLTATPSRSAKRGRKTLHSIWRLTPKVTLSCQTSKASAWTRRRRSSGSSSQHTTVSSVPISCTCRPNSLQGYVAANPRHLSLGLPLEIPRRPLYPAPICHLAARSRIPPSSKLQK